MLRILIQISKERERSVFWLELGAKKVLNKGKELLAKSGKGGVFTRKKYFLDIKAKYAPLRQLRFISLIQGGIEKERISSSSKWKREEATRERRNVSELGRLSESETVRWLVAGIIPSFRTKRERNSTDQWFESL